MAFHLHRLRLVGRALHVAGYHKTDAADLAAARRHLSEAEVSELAGRFNIAPEELLRTLTADEKRSWAFYRAAATNPQEVWEAARRAWTAEGVNAKQAAAIMGLAPRAVAEARSKHLTMTFQAALRLTTALKLPGGPEALLPLRKDNSNTPIR